MKIIIESKPVGSGCRPHVTISVDATVDEIVAARKAMIDCGYPIDCTPMAVMAQICHAGRNTAQEALAPV